MSQEVSFYYSIFCFCLMLSVFFSTCSISCLFTSYLTNQDMKLFKRCHSGLARPLRLLQKDISNSRVDTSSLKLLLPGTGCALYHSPSIICCLYRWVHHLMKIIQDGVTPKPLHVNSITHLDKTPKSKNLHQHWSILSTCWYKIDFLTWFLQNWFSDLKIYE